MPLSSPAPRRKLHTRTIVCNGYQREDGLWDVEGHMIDAKTYGFPNRFRGEVKAGEPVHEMWLRLTIDDGLLIHHAEAATDHGPYEICPAITARFRSLEGIRIGPGWTRDISQRVGGTRGCTHLVELLKPIATTAYQTLVAAKKKTQADSRTPKHKPLFINTCHAMASDGAIVKEFWPEHYTGE